MDNAKHASDPKTSRAHSRRTFLKAAGGAAALTAAGALTAGRAFGAASVRPNILWLSTEDISPNLGCYGDPDAITPTLDKLAARGVRYTNAFTTAGVCAPVRSGVISGIFPSTLGSMHMRSGNPDVPAHVKCFTQYLRDAGYYCANNSKTDYNFKASKEAWDESSKQAHWRKRPAGKPFFYVRNFTGTHESQIGRDADAQDKVVKRLKANERQDAKKVHLPPYYPDTPITRHDWATYLENITDMDYQAGDVLKQLEEDGLAGNTIVFFWSDHGAGLPRAKRWLYDSGTHIPLIVYIPEKLRAGGQGKPGTDDDRLVSSIDFAPTVLNLAGVKIPVNMRGQSFLGPNPAPPREYVYGARDRMDERYDIIRAVRDKRYRYLRNYTPFRPYYQYMNTPENGGTMRELRRLHKEGKLPPAAAIFMADTKPVEELYDLSKDPHELRNLIGDPKLRTVLERLRQAHRRWMLETKDLGLFPEAELDARGQKLGARYDILRQPGGDEITERLFDAATLAGGPTAKDAPALARALADEEPAVRYWGAMGLANIGAPAKTQSAPLTAALNDQTPCVRVAAAFALCKMNLEKQGLPLLTQELKSEHQWVRLQAAVALDEIGDGARPAIANLRECLKDQPNKYITRVANRTLNKLQGTDNRVK